MEPNEVLERAAWLVRSQSERVKMQEDLQKVFQLDWNDEALRNKPDWVKPVKDPQTFNSMQWLVDVLAHDEPNIQIEIPEGSLPGSVPQLQLPAMPMMGMGGVAGVGGNGMSPMGMGGGMPGADPLMQDMLGATGMMSGEAMGQADDEQARKDMGDMLEKTAQEIYRQNDLRSPTSLQRDELYAAFVNGMVVDKIADLRLSGNKWGKYAAKNRGASPFYVRSLNPAHVYFEWDEYGVCEVFQRYMRPLREVKRLYGGKVLGLENVKATEANGYVEFCEYWTEDVQAMWVERVYYNGWGDENWFSGQEPIGSGYFVQAPKGNPLGFIPYALKVARGSSVFNRTNMVYPHLYAGHKSKLFLRQNLFLTVASTLAFMLVNPQFAHETDMDNPIELDFSAPAVHKIAKGDKLTPLEMKISRDFYDVMTVIASKVEESTVSKVVAGQSPGGVTAASGINLLIGGGKLTVSSVQKAMGEVRAQATGKIFEFMKMYPQFAPLESARLEMMGGGKFNSIDPASLPERMDIKVEYQPFMPQDKALAVQTWLQPLMAKLISSDFFYGQTGVQDVVTLRRQIQQDKDRELADLQFQQQLQMAQAQEMAGGSMAGQEQQPEGLPGIEGQQKQAIDTPEANPQESMTNPATMLNEMANSIANPMSG